MPVPAQPAADPAVHAATRYALDLAALMRAGDATDVAERARRVASPDDLADWLVDAAAAVERHAGPGGSVVFLSKMAKVVPPALAARLLS